MKLDLYTKSILTIIAMCLTINVLKDFDIMPKAYANEPLKNELNLLPNKNYGLIPVNSDGSINVNIAIANVSKPLAHVLAFSFLYALSISKIAVPKNTNAKIFKSLINAILLNL